MSGFAELCVTTNFSFLRSGSHPEEMVEQALALGLVGIGVADRNTLAGVVRAHVKAKSLRQEGKGELRTIVGSRLVFRDGTPDLVVYPKDRAAYANLTRLLTIGNRRAPKGECWLDFADYLAHATGLQTILIPAFALGDEPYALGSYLQQIKAAAGEVWLAAPFQFNGEDRRRIRRLKQLAAQTGARLLATTEPLVHRGERRALLDVVSCIREKKKLSDAGALLAKNAERQLKPPQEIARIFREAPEAVAESLRFLEGVSFSMEHLRYEYPEETADGYSDPQQALEALAWEGAHVRYPEGIPEIVSAALKRELDIVGRIKYAPYFLTVADIVTFARSGRDKDGNKVDPILCQGRGSAANSTICYCLGITSVNPAKSTLLFERFVSEERGEPPDIDVDFEHERREEVIQYIYKKYGRDRAGLAATLICYRGRSAIREVAKVFGYSEDRISSLAKTLHWWSRGVEKKDLLEQGLDVNDVKLMQCVTLSNELQGFPRHLSQHVGGFVITREKLHDVVPVQNAAMEDRTVVEWNKDDLEDLGILKVDVLGLGMLTCLKKAFDLCEKHYPGAEMVKLDSSYADDERVYKMLHRADSVGVFQVESRAQMSMLPRLQPKDFYDLVIEVAIVRPGPIQGGMVHPYLKRRQGLEKASAPKPELWEVLKRTLGVPLFQEQAMQIAITAAGFTPSEADKLRRAMATFKRVGTIGSLKDKFINGMIANGYDNAFAEASFAQIEGFGEYGFPESHAASFALLVYASSWLKCYYPDVFAAALLNAQPMGFYAPAQIVRDAIDHGVEVRPIDVNHSMWDNILEQGPEAAKRLHVRHSDMAGDIRSTHAMRLGYRQAQGLKEAEMRQLVANRGVGYDSVRDVWLRSGLPPSTIERLADLDGFRSLGLDRRDALWAARGLNRVGGQEDLPLFECGADRTREPDFDLPSMALGEHIVEDYRTIGLSLKAHPAAMLRDELAARRVIKSEDLTQIRNGDRVRVAGLVLVRQRPGTASGVIFMTLEDETGIANIVVWPKLFEQYRREVLGGRLVAIDGPVQSESGVIHVIAERVHDYTPLLAKLSASGERLDASGPTDEPRKGTYEDPRQAGHPRNVRINLDVSQAANVMPKGRNFH
ncbi:error-prone DNA polymerase [Candidatus Viadribacter manganicus]|uniref:Error-prone DNA polymerase n=1 Tax=Candidatus Viadribacter manganicus TaxID=1759059 RepID=A0A1B1AE84_9PROT|nr:error-prone DNA polymerase [Candidatus Viadribacter manganicus]ANP44874.1 DNA polymerase [Candidatus Viadribacter manganicus]